MEKTRIALLGLGTVGTGAWKIIRDNGRIIEKKAGCSLEVVKILVKDLHKRRGVELPAGILTVDYGSIVDDPDIDIIVEVIGGVTPAKDYILRALKAGKQVVTANKAVLAQYGSEIFETAQRHNSSIRYEASVCGGIPIINILQESLASNEIEEVAGILNGTTNYILTKMTEEGQAYETALREAQELGYAEADPSSDVEGHDAAYKLAILAHLAFGTKLGIKDIRVKGIGGLTRKDIAEAKEAGFCIKLIARARKENDGYSLGVGPERLPLKHPLAGVSGVNNAVLVRGNAVKELMFYGQGAGEMPTGSAVVGDIIALARNREKY
ncbi:MAG TPA: homoserine dehydrogenase [Clostridia bacterium]|nr:homoserine dehydrogenase [Clostridia bacterium]